MSTSKVPPPPPLPSAEPMTQDVVNPAASAFGMTAAPLELTPTCGNDDKEASAGAWESAPEGGYGIVVALASFCISAMTWGINTSFGYFISYFLENNYFDGGSPIGYALVGGLSVCTALLAAPLSNYLAKRFHFKVPLLIGALCVVLGQALAGVSRSFGGYLVCQGIIFGIGIGMTFIPVPPVMATWFQKRLSLATGLAGGGSGFGCLVFSNTTRLSIAKLGVKNTLIINGCVSGIVLVPAIFVLRARVDKTKVQPKLEALHVSYLWHRGFVWIWLWGCFAIIGCFIGLYSVASFASKGLGLSQTQAAALQSIIGAGQIIGRPACGWALDRGGRVNVNIAIHVFIGVACFALWMPARGFALLAIFALVMGLLGGTLWFSVSSLTALVVGPEHMGSALAIFWLAIASPALVSQFIATSLISYSTNQLGLTGPDTYRISIAFCGACYITSGLMLLGAKFYAQKNCKLWQKI